jgi:hypothetical protein
MLFVQEIRKIIEYVIGNKYGKKTGVFATKQKTIKKGSTHLCGTALASPPVTSNAMRDLEGRLPNTRDKILLLSLSSLQPG